MRVPTKAFYAAIAISIGLIVLLGYFIPGLESIRAMVMAWSAILAAFALLAGVLNLFAVHANRALRGSKGAIYSVIFIFAFLGTLAAAGISGPTGEWSLWIFNNIQTPIEAALLALLVITLTTAAVRMLRRRLNVYGVLFIFSAAFVLLGSIPLFWIGNVELLTDLSRWFSQVAALGGVRGLLLGIALGTLAAGLRILMGVDRPYGG